MAIWLFAQGQQKSLPLFERIEVDKLHSQCLSWSVLFENNSVSRAQQTMVNGQRMAVLMQPMPAKPQEGSLVSSLQGSCLTGGSATSRKARTADVWRVSGERNSP